MASSNNTNETNSRAPTRREFLDDRRERAFELYAHGWSQIEIAAALKCPRRTIANDLAIVRKQKEEERKHREQSYLSEFGKVCSNLESLRRQAWIDFASLRQKEKAGLRLEMYHIAMEVEDAVLQAMEMRNIMECKVALQRLKNKDDNIKDDINRANVCSRQRSRRIEE